MKRLTALTVLALASQATVCFAGPPPSKEVVAPPLPPPVSFFRGNEFDIGIFGTYVTGTNGGLTRATNFAAPLGAGAVAIFDENGNFIKQLIVGSRLAAPWGIAVAPPGFGRFSNHLLVGNFSFLHSEINAFNRTNGKFHGTIPIEIGANSPGGLWTIGFGVGGSNGSPDTLYFTDGINGEMNGLFGAINRLHGP